MIDLTNTTIIITLKVESQDRLDNAVSVLGYLNHHFKTNVLIYEQLDGESKLGFVESLKNLNTKIIYGGEKFAFHKTKYLNKLLKMVETPVVLNYDIDVIFPVETYRRAERMIMSGDAEVIYPFPDGYGQIRVFQDFDRENFNKNFDVEEINRSPHTDRFRSIYGHACFIKASIYRECGGENEKFISWGPEDQERLYRFQKLNRKLIRFEGGLVYHFEHSRGPDSGPNNILFNENCLEFEKIKRMTVEEIQKYLPPL